MLNALALQNEFRVCYFDANFSHPSFDALVNFNAFAGPTSYSTQRSETRYFLGKDFFPIRQELNKAAAKVSGIPKKGIFICFGGTDHLGLTLGLVRRLARENVYEICLGPGCVPDYVSRVKEQFSRRRLKGNVHWNPVNFFDLAGSCEVAWVSASSIAYELAYLGVPVSVVKTADNQERLAQFLEVQGIPLHSIEEIVGTARFNSPLLPQTALTQVGSRLSELIDYLRGSVDNG